MVATMAIDPWEDRPPLETAGDAPPGLTRRRALTLIVGASSLGAGLGPAALARPVGARARPLAPTLPPAPAQTPSPIVKPLPPEWFVAHGTNAETRWDSVSTKRLVTPNERFFVRNHTSTPLIDATIWRLRLHGSGVRRPLDLSHRELRRLPSRTTTALIECAGNGRSFFGTQQGQPAVLRARLSGGRSPTHHPAGEERA
jgi:DMSO/TMAO reductase YedYZ molybdopterin-dependent catalytic subunit